MKKFLITPPFSVTIIVTNSFSYTTSVLEKHEKEAILVFILALNEIFKQYKKEKVLVTCMQ